MNAGRGLISIADQAVVGGVNLFTTVLLARICGTNELGIYALGWTIVSIIVYSIQWSLIVVPYTVFVSKKEQHEKYRFSGSAVFHNLLLSLVTMAALFIFADFSFVMNLDLRLTPIMRILAVLMPFILFKEFGRRVAMANMHMDKALILDTAVGTIQIIFLITFAAIGKLSSSTAFIAFGCASAMGGLAFIAVARHKLIFRRAIVFQDLLKNFSYGKWVFLGKIAASLSFSLIPWILSIKMGHSAAGVFTACLNIVFFFGPLIRGFGNYLTPEAASSYSTSGAPGVYKLVLSATLLVALSAAGFCVAILIFGDDIVTLVYGNQLSGHGNVVFMLSLLVFVLVFDTGSANGLFAIRRPGVFSVGSAGGMVVTLFLGMVFITPFGINGAAISLLIGFFISICANWTAFTYLAYSGSQRSAVQI